MGCRHGGIAVSDATRTEELPRIQEAIEYLKSATADIRVCGELYGYKLTPALEIAMRSIEGEIAVLEYKVRELEAVRNEW